MKLFRPAPSQKRLPRTWRAVFLILGVAASTLVVAQSAQDIAQQPPTNPNLGPAFATKNAAYVPVMFDEIPGWDSEDFNALYTNFSTNCRAMRRRSAWAPLCARLAKLPRSDEALKQFMDDEFYAYQMLTPTRSEAGKLTGYFEPLISGSLTRQGAYRYPVYGTPSDMYQIDSRTVVGQPTRWLKRSDDGRLVGAETGEAGAVQYRIALEGGAPNPRDKRYRVRIDGGTIRPYYARQEIDAKGINAPVLAWVADPYKLYSMQIQGSGKIQLKDGGLIRLAYAEQNGHPFMPQATRGDSDAMLLAIKARGLDEPLEVEIPGGTRGVKKPGSNAGVDAEVARIIAALQGGGTASATSIASTSSAKPKNKRPAATTQRPRARVNETDVEAMIQLLLTAPVADETYTAPQDTDVANIIDSTAPEKTTSKPTSTEKTARLDVSAFQGSGNSKPAGTASGAGVPVPSTGIPDPSFVFFRRIGDGPEGPIGALGVPLSAGRSMAVDPRATPLGAPVFIEGLQPGTDTPMRRLMFAQDTGGAIRGSVRGDFFWGFGDKAGKMALATNQTVRMWLMLPKAVAGSAAASGIKTRGSASLRDCAVPDDELCVEN